MVVWTQDGDRQRADVEGLGEPLLGNLQRLLREFALGHFALELLVAFLESAGALVHEAVEVFELVPRLLGDEPLLGQRVRELEDFDAVERLLENDQPVGLAELGDDVLPRVVRVGGADHDLDRRIDFPDAA